MAGCAALLVDELFAEQPVRQWVLSVPYPLRCLFASRPEVMGGVLGIVYRCIVAILGRFGASCTGLQRATEGILAALYVSRRPKTPIGTASSDPN